MPKNPTRNIESYQLEDHEINEFDFQKNQKEMAEESEVHFPNEENRPSQDRANDVEAITAAAHRKVENKKRTERN